MRSEYIKRLHPLVMQVTELADQHREQFENEEGYDLGEGFSYKRSERGQHIFYGRMEIATVRDGRLLRTGVKHIPYEKLARLEERLPVVVLSLNGHR